MVDSLTIAQVEERASALVAGLDGTPYQQGPAVPRWTETRSLSIIDEAASVIHLRYHASVSDSQSNGGHRGSGYGTEQMESSLVVSFAYHLVPAQHAADLRKAHDAAQDVVKIINRDCSGDWSPRFVGIATGIDVERGVAIKAVTFSVIHIIEV